MKTILKHFCLCVFLTSIAFACNSPDPAELQQLRDEVAHLEEKLGPPPASLAQYYPPKAQQPVYPS